MAVTEVVVEPGKEKEKSSSGLISIDGMEFTETAFPRLFPTYYIRICNKNKERRKERGDCDIL